MRHRNRRPLKRMRLTSEHAPSTSKQHLRSRGALLARGSIAMLLLACSGGGGGGNGVSTYFAGGDVGLVNIYAGTGANALSPVAKRARPLVYVPNAKGASVTVIDPTTYTVVRPFKTGRVPQPVVPSYDLTRLWVANNSSNSLPPIDPETGADGPPVKVEDPYNLYFTPD